MTIRSASHSLADLPDIVSEFHLQLNGELRPEHLRPGSNRLVWWRCSRGRAHEWQARVVDRAKGRGCPFCSNHRVSATNSLATRYPKIARFWHPTKNGLVTPDTIIAGATRRYWWRPVTAGTSGRRHRLPVSAPVATAPTARAAAARWR